jgi:hypothetical protein
MNSPSGDSSRHQDQHSHSRPFHEQGQFDNCKVFVGGLHYETTVGMCKPEH